MTDRRMPPAQLFLALWLGSWTAAVLFVARAVAVDMTVERVISALVFAALGFLWLYMWRSLSA